MLWRITYRFAAAVMLAAACRTGAQTARLGSVSLTDGLVVTSDVGIVANGLRVAAVEARTNAWNAAQAWGNHAAAGYLPANVWTSWLDANTFSNAIGAATQELATVYAVAGLTTTQTMHTASIAAIGRQAASNGVAVAALSYSNGVAMAGLSETQRWNTAYAMAVYGLSYSNGVAVAGLSETQRWSTALAMAAYGLSYSNGVAMAALTATQAVNTVHAMAAYGLSYLNAADIARLTATQGVSTAYAAEAYRLSSSVSADIAALATTQSVNTVHAKVAYGQSSSNATDIAALTATQSMNTAYAVSAYGMSYLNAADIAGLTTTQEMQTAALATNRVTVWSSPDGSRWATIEPGRNYGTLWYGWFNLIAETDLISAEYETILTSGVYRVQNMQIGSGNGAYGIEGTARHVEVSDDSVRVFDWVFSSEYGSYDRSFTNLVLLAMSGAVGSARLVFEHNKLYFPTTTNAALNLDTLLTADWVANWMDYGNAGQLWASGLADDAARSFMNAHTGAADPHPGTYTPLSVGAALTSAVARIDREKELHADSYTNLIWRTVWSNGWCWAVAYTNTP